MKNKNPILVAFGKHLRTLREARGYSQESFAEEAEFGRSYYGRVERGESNISLLTLYRIAKTLDMRIDEIFPPK